MMAIKQTCLLLVAGLWTSALLGSGYTGSTMVGGWTEQNPQGSPKYLKLAHYAVSTQTEGETVYNTVVNLTNVATQVRADHCLFLCLFVVAGVNYNLTFTTAPTSCRIGQVQYSATQCPPAGPVNGKCSAIVYVVPWMNTTQVTSYTCSGATN
ncbi:cystatin-2 isoform X1 [Rhipicephalus microplus]|uniref:cystatin-2 isoform X1 n=1 Tax=Rhipicephalus microplus TaxID=6941 RepID=UPI003F6A92F4